MELTRGMLYLVTRVNTIWNSCLIIVILGGLTLILCAIIKSIIGTDDYYCNELILVTQTIKYLKYIWLIAVTLIILLPTQKEMAAIYIIPKITNSQFIQELPKDIETLAQEWLAELKPKKDNK